jgi:hypothetical protein
MTGVKNILPVMGYIIPDAKQVRTLNERFGRNRMCHILIA